MFRISIRLNGLDVVVTKFGNWVILFGCVVLCAQVDIQIIDISIRAGVSSRRIFSHLLYTIGMPHREFDDFIEPEYRINITFMDISSIVHHHHSPKEIGFWPREFIVANVNCLLQEN